MLTAEEKELRRKYIGGSDVAKIMGISPFGSKLDLWLEKKHGVYTEAGEAAALGDMLEGPMIDWMIKEMGLDPLGILTNERTFKDWRTAQHDALYFKVPGSAKKLHADFGIEAKTSGLLNPFFRSHEAGWGETSTDNPSDAVPDFVLVQALHQMEVADLDKVYIPALIAGSDGGRKIYLVNRDEKLIAAMIEAETRFMEDHIKADVRPPMDDRPPNLELLKQIQSIEGKILTLEEDDMITEWLDAKDAAREATKESEGCRNKIIGLLKAEEAEAIEFPGGIFRYSEEGGSRRTDMKKLESDYPEAYKDCVTKGTRMVPRFKKHKG